MHLISINKIDKLLLRSFIFTFFLLFTLVLFILIIHTFFLVFQEAAGKGLGAVVYAKLLFYIGLSVFPNAFPIAILMSALIVFGHLAENYELTAMRAAGLSLQRTLRLPFIFVLIISGALFYFQDYIHPTTKHKIFALWDDILSKKAALLIQPGIICNDIPGYSIYVDKKQKGKEHMEGIILYDYTQMYGAVALTTAARGRLYFTSDESYLIMELVDGHNYVEPLSDQKDHTSSDPHTFYRNSFSSQKIRISLEALKLGNTKEKYEYDTRTRIRPQLQQLIKELKQKIATTEDHACILLREACRRYELPTSSDQLEQPAASAEAPIAAQEDPFIRFRNQLIKSPNSTDNTLQTTPSDRTNVQRIVWGSLYAIEQIKTKLAKQRELVSGATEYLKEASYTQHNRIAIAMRCIIMFLLAAPLGCIIRRGGFGTSVLISSFFMLVEYMLSIWGRELALEHKCATFVGAWLANIVLLPFCIFCLLQAQQGMGLLSVDKYILYVQNIKKYIRWKRIGKHV